MMIKMTFLVILMLLKLIQCHQFSFGAVYQNNMVLQRAPHKAIIWGYAQLHSNISITFKNKLYISKAINSNGYDYPVWKIALDPVYDTNSHDLEFIGQSTAKNLSKISLKNVLFGDIWLCSGQSNMQLSLNATLDGREEIETGHQFKNKIRLFTVQTFSSSKVEFDLKQIKQNWSEPSPQSLGSFDWEYFSAVCWHFGKKLAQNLDHPIGLLVSCWGGSQIERWMSKDSIKKCNITNQNSNHSGLWNSMIHPLFNFAIYGVVWYQGESNTDYNTDKYGCSFEKMVDDWRQNWFKQTEGSTKLKFPFGFVQLANSERHGDFVDNWPLVRWYQTASYGFSPNPKLENVFMATAIDLVDNGADPIHPKLKSDVGIRLALGALNLAYGQPLEYAPPKLKLVEDKGKSVFVEFMSDFGPFQFKKANTTKGFDLCCDSIECLEKDTQDWIWTSNFSLLNQTVIIDKPISCARVNYVRYLWRHKPCEFKMCPLYSFQSNLPVYPFLSKVSNGSQFNRIKIVISIFLLISANGTKFIQII